MYTTNYGAILEFTLFQFQHKIIVQASLLYGIKYATEWSESGMICVDES